MDRRLARMLDLLDVSDGVTCGTSVRIPVNLRDAATLATELGLTTSTSELAVRGLRDALEAFAQRAVLDAHYQAHPKAHPQLAEIALATAELDGNPLAAMPDLVRRAAAEIGTIKDDATPDDVLIYAAGLAATAA